MQARAFVFGAAWLTLGVLFAGGWFPGADTVADGPRIGLAVGSFTFALLVLGVPLAGWYVRKYARPDASDKCPVGQSCKACETFNFHPRTTCRECGAALQAVPS